MSGIMFSVIMASWKFVCEKATSCPWKLCQTWKTHVLTSDAHCWHVAIIGMMRSICTLLSKRDINGTSPHFRIDSLFTRDSDSEHRALAPAHAISMCSIWSPASWSRDVNKISSLISSKSTSFAMPPNFRTSFRANRTFATFDNVSAAIRFKSNAGSDKMATSNGIPSKSTIDFRMSVFAEIFARTCNAPRRHLASLLSSKLTSTSSPPMSWIACKMFTIEKFPSWIYDVTIIQARKIMTQAQ